MTTLNAVEFKHYSAKNAQSVEDHFNCDCKAYVDIFTYKRWQDQKMQVQKGSTGTRIQSWIEKERKDGTKVTFPKTTTVFCRHQVQLIDTDNPPIVKNTVIPRQKVPNEALQIRLIKMADALTLKIDEKLNPATAQQNPTHRRMGIIESMRQDGYHMQEIQTALYKLADLHGAQDQRIKDITTKKTVERLKWDNPTLWALLTEDAPKIDTTAQELEDDIKELQFKNIDGYFPTPDELIDRMIELADIKKGMHVLEPSAGAGHIADKLKALGAYVYLCETSYTLQDILKRKGYKNLNNDFMEFSTVPLVNQGYDAVVMNPPFEHGQDADHIRRAFMLLCPDGTLVSIAGEGIFFRNDKKSTAFREWLEFVGGYSEKLPENSFIKSGTGVNTRLVVIHK